jgi:hypothetical protein
LRHVFDRQDGLIELAPVGRFLGLGGFGNRSELHKGVVALHFDARQFTERFKQHLQVFLFCCFFVKINDKECFRGSNVAAAFVFLALDSAVSTSKLGTERARDVGDLPVMIVMK